MRQFVAAGAEFLSVGGNEANGAAVGPDYFRRYILEYEVRLMNALHGFGGRAIYHNCGRAALLLPVLREIGMDIYESLTPPPFGDTDLARSHTDHARGRANGRDRPDRVPAKGHAGHGAAARSRKWRGSPREHGRFILGTSDYINENTPAENLHAMRAALDAVPDTASAQDKPY